MRKGEKLTKMNKVALSGKVSGVTPLTVFGTNANGDGEERKKCVRFWISVKRALAKRTEYNAAGDCADLWEEREDSIRCVAFGILADYARERFKDGTAVEIEGELQTESYTRADCTGGQNYCVVMDAARVLDSDDLTTNEYISLCGWEPDTKGNIEELHYHAPDDLWGALND